MIHLVLTTDNTAKKTWQHDQYQHNIVLFNIVQLGRKNNSWR